MNRLLFALALSLAAGGAHAQTGGATSGGASSPGAPATPGAAAPRAPSAASRPPGTAVPGAPSTAPSPSAPLSTDLFPPSRLQQPPGSGVTAPATPGSSAATGSAAGTPAPAAPRAQDPNLPATNSGGRAAGNPSRTGKNPINERYADCMSIWDAGTHMTKAEWSRTCRRIQNRLQNLQVENLDVDVMGPKPRKKERGPGAG